MVDFVCGKGDEVGFVVAKVSGGAGVGDGEAESFGEMEAAPWTIARTQAVCSS